MTERFALAPMSRDLRIMTWVVIAIPASMAFAAASAPPPTSIVLWSVVAFLVLTYASVALWWRPTAFAVSPSEMVIRWPLRSRVIDLRSLRGVAIVTAREFRRQYGRGMRVGAGGLWGGFGLLVTKPETFTMYISRTDRFVVLRPAVGRALLLTPVDPERFADAVRHRVET